MMVKSSTVWPPLLSSAVTRTSKTLPSYRGLTIYAGVDGSFLAWYPVR